MAAGRKTVRKKSATLKKASKKKVTKGAKAKKKAPAKKKVAKKKAPAKKKVAKKKVAKKKAPARKKAPAKLKKKAAPAKKAAKKTTRKAAPGKAASLSSRDRKQLRKLLFEARERLTGQIASLQGDSLRRDDRVNPEEDGSDAFERQIALTLASSEQDSLNAIDGALLRLEEGTYGMCAECGCRIEKPRLQALPFVTTCIACQSELEERGLVRRRSF